MKSELKAAWINDLRNHPELQGQGFLRTVYNKYCCLGRLLELDGTEWEKTNEHSNFYISGSGLSGYLSAKEIRKFGLNAVVPNTPNTIENYLMRMNDAGHPFYYIADWIEANVPAD